MSFHRINIEESKRIIAEDGPIVIDVRDAESFAASHVENALHIDNSNVQEFIDATDKSIPLVIYCYHGNMSQGAANHFFEQGFTTVYSVDGGFEEWRHQL